MQTMQAARIWSDVLSDATSRPYKADDGGPPGMYSKVWGPVLAT